MDYRALKTAVKQRLKSVLLHAYTVIQQLDTPNTVLLTFDDGPHPTITPAVLERLRAYHARAVFFVVGSRIGHAPHLLPQMLTAGHVLGNHTYVHALERDPGPVGYVRDLQQCQKLVTQLTGQAPTLFRPSLGRITLTSMTAPKLLRLKTLYWSVDPQDWRLRTEEDALACGQCLAETVRPGDIVLLHDNHPCVVPVLDVLLPALSARRYDLALGVQMFQ